LEEELLNRLFLGMRSHVVLATSIFHFSGTGGIVSGLVEDKKVDKGEMEGGEWEGL
jgi:hypothetical protein